MAVSKSTPYKLRGVDKSQFRKLYWDDGLTLAEVGRRFGVAGPTMTAWFRRLGIPTRSPNETRYARARVPKVCGVCGKQFYATAYQAEHGRGATCSRACAAIRRSRLIRGENSPTWRGGITPAVRRVRASKQYAEWRDKVFARDGYACHWCGAHTRDLVAHHTTPFSVVWEQNGIVTAWDAFDCPELWRLDIAVTLCGKCHRSVNHRRLRADYRSAIRKTARAS